MNEKHPLSASSRIDDLSSAKPSLETPKPLHGASFDTSDSGQALSNLKKLQDPSKYDKARFSFRLYKR